MWFVILVENNSKSSGISTPHFMPFNHWPFRGIYFLLYLIQLLVFNRFEEEILVKLDHLHRQGQNLQTNQLLPSDLMITQIVVPEPLKGSLKTPKKVTGKNLEIVFVILLLCQNRFPFNSLSKLVLIQIGETCCTIETAPTLSVEALPCVIACIPCGVCFLNDQYSCF